MAAVLTMTTVFGGNLVAQFFSVLLYGVLLAQCYSYFLNHVFKHDTLFLKVSVAVVWLLESFHTVCVIHYVYQSTIKDFGNLPKVGNSPWSASLSFIVNMFIVGFVQGYYVRRIWILSNRSIFLALGLSVLIVIRIGFGLATSALGFKLHNYAVFQVEIGPRVTVICGLSFGALNDTLIALTSMWFLYHKRTGIPSSDRIIRILMAYIVNTGVLAMLVSVLTLITYLTMKNSSLFVGLALVTAKLYSNSFLGTLNVRDPLRATVIPDTYNSAELSTFPATGSLPHKRQTHVDLDDNDQSTDVKVFSSKTAPAGVYV